MQVNGVNSFSNAQAFRGAEGEGKKNNKKAAIAAGIGAAAVIGATVAAGLHGKKISEGVEGNVAKKALAFVKAGAVDIFNKAKGKTLELVDAIKTRLAKATEEVGKEAGKTIE